MAIKKNKFIKAANEKTEYTPEQIEELKKCANDPVYFIKNYVMIQHPVRGVIPFHLYDYQVEMVNAYMEHRFTIVMSARQSGKCLTPDTVVTIIVPPTTGLINLIKKCILWGLDRKQYNELFNNSK